MRYIYTTEYYSAIKKNKMMPFAATWMDLESVLLSEGSHPLPAESKKKLHKWTCLQNKHRFIHLENELMVAREKDGKKG